MNIIYISSTPYHFFSHRMMNEIKLMMLPDGPITFQFLTSQFLLLKSTKIECFIFHEGFVISILVHRSAAIISIVICMLRLFTQATHPFSMACLLFVYVCTFFLCNLGSLFRPICKFWSTLFMILSDSWTCMSISSRSRPRSLSPAKLSCDSSVVTSVLVVSSLLHPFESSSSGLFPIFVYGVQARASVLFLLMMMLLVLGAYWLFVQLDW